MATYRLLKVNSPLPYATISPVHYKGLCVLSTFVVQINRPLCCGWRVLNLPLKNKDTTGIRELDEMAIYVQEDVFSGN